MAPSPFKDNTSAKLILTKWRLAADAVVDAVTDGTPIHRELRYLEDNLCNFISLSVWCDHRNHVLTCDPNGDRMETKELLRLNIRGTELWNRLIENGFVETVQNAAEGWSSKALRVIGAIILEPTVLADFVDAAYAREPLPAWVQRRKKTRPVEFNIPDGPSFSGTA